MQVMDKDNSKLTPHKNVQMNSKSQQFLRPSRKNLIGRFKMLTYSRKSHTLLISAPVRIRVSFRLSTLHESSVKSNYRSHSNFCSLQGVVVPFTEGPLIYAPVQMQLLLHAFSSVLLLPSAE